MTDRQRFFEAVLLRVHARIALPRHQRGPAKALRAVERAAGL